MAPSECANEEHGCGYRDGEGNLHSTYSVWGVRSLMKRLYEIVEKRGRTINCHANASWNLSAMSFCHSIWEGERIQEPFLHGKMTGVPTGYFLSTYGGRNFGVHINMLCYSNPPVWTFEKATGMALLVGTMPKPVDIGQPLEEMSILWKMTDSFDFKNADWHMFNSLPEDIVIDNNIKLSYYENDKQILAVFANISNQINNVAIKLPQELKEITACSKKDIVKITDDGCELEIDGFGYVMFLANK